MRTPHGKNRINARRDTPCDFDLQKTAPCPVATATSENALFGASDAPLLRERAQNAIAQGRPLPCGATRDGDVAGSY